MTLALAEEDLRLMLASNCQTGTKNLESDMKEYVFKRASTGLHIINLAKTWEKILLAARVLVAIENPKDVCVVSASQYGQRASYKFGQFTGANVVSSRFTPGTFTNQICRSYQEPRILLVTDPRTDSQPVNEASYVNIPVIAFCGTDSPLRCIDIAIPCNNKGQHSLAVMYWLLAREVLRMRAVTSRISTWEVSVDLFIHKDPEEAEKEQNEAQQRQLEQAAVPAQRQPLDDGQQQQYVDPQQEQYVDPQQQVPTSEADWMQQQQQPVDQPEQQIAPEQLSYEQQQNYQRQQQQPQQQQATYDNAEQSTQQQFDQRPQQQQYDQRPQQQQQQQFDQRPPMEQGGQFAQQRYQQQSQPQQQQQSEEWRS